LAQQSSKDSKAAKTAKQQRQQSSKDSMLDIPKNAEVLFFHLLSMNNINMLQDVIFRVVT
jgi:hypothetical protein